MRYGPVMIDLKSPVLSTEEKTILQHPNVGGVILFTRNYTGIAALKGLVQELRQLRKGAPLLIAVDHEGGRVWRFNEGFTKLPPAQHYGDLYAKDPAEGLLAARNAGWVMAAELLNCGIDLSLAPVLDVDRGISQVIEDRAFSSNPEIIAILASAFIEGMNQVGMSATGKHFPGHGGCAPDSHVAQAIDDRTLEVLLKEDMIPFIKLSSKLGAVMPAHVIYPKVDAVPAGYSKRFLQDILRADLSFQGAIISDCLSMKGAAMGGDFVLRARMSLDAGCDMVILCQQERELLAWVLDKLDRTTSEDSQGRLAALAGKFQSAGLKAPLPSLMGAQVISG